MLDSAWPPRLSIIDRVRLAHRQRFLIVTITPRLARWVRESALREQDDIVASLQLPSIEGSKVMVLCARGDEVRGWLRMWDVAAQAAFVTGGFLLWAVAAAARSNLWSSLTQLQGPPFTRVRQDSNPRVRRLGTHHERPRAVWALGCRADVQQHRPVARILGRATVGQRARRNRITKHSERAGRDHRTAHKFDTQPGSLRRRITTECLRHTAICEDRVIVSAVGDWMNQPGQRLFGAARTAALASNLN